MRRSLEATRQNCMYNIAQNGAAHAEGVGVGTVAPEGSAFRFRAEKAVAARRQFDEESRLKWLALGGSVWVTGQPQWSWGSFSCSAASRSRNAGR